MSGWRILAHGGAGSEAELSPVTCTAAERAGEALAEGAEPLAAAVRAVAFLEAAGRFNAGRGSHVRADGETLQADAACADSTGRFGAVACLEGIRHPIEAARAVTGTEHLVLAGEGARSFARKQGLAPADTSEHEPAGQGADTVGCVLTDGDVFAAALSSGGTEGAMVGRVGDVPLPGCGLRAGAAGAVACTGHGETITRERLADHAYQRLEHGVDVDEVVAEITERIQAQVGLIAVTAGAGAGGSNRSMAYAEVER